MPFIFFEAQSELKHWRLFGYYSWNPFKLMYLHKKEHKIDTVTLLEILRLPPWLKTSIIHRLVL